MSGEIEQKEVEEIDVEWLLMLKETEPKEPIRKKEMKGYLGG